MRVFAYALGGTLGNYLGVKRRIGIIHLGKKARELKMASLLAARIALAKAAADAPHSTHLAHLRTLLWIVAENMDRRGSRDERDNAARTGAYALAASNAKTLIHLGKAIGNRDSALWADVRAGAIAKASVDAAFVAAGGGGRHAAIANAVVAANAYRLGARAAALDERNALLGGDGGNAKNLRYGSTALASACGARTVGGSPRHKCASIAVAPRETTSAAVGAWQSGSDKANARIFADTQKFICKSQKNSCGETDKSNRKNCNNHLKSPLQTFIKTAKAHECKSQKPTRHKRESNAAKRARRIGVLKLLANA